MRFKYLFAFALLLLGSLAQARVDFELRPFNVSEFNDFAKLEQTCTASPTASFWCERLDDDLSLITTKGADYFFDNSGEIVALFTKQQKGQNIRNYNVDSNQNLVPINATVPGGAILLNGEYTAPAAPENEWVRLESGEGDYYQGTFSYSLDGVDVEKELIVRNVAHITGVTLTATRSGEAGEEGAAEEGSEGEGAVLEPLTVQYAQPGIAKSDPVVKVGHGETFSLNPPADQPFNNPTYISLQNNNRNTANAIILRPGDVTDTEVAAEFVAPNLITLQKTLPAEPGASVTLDIQEYGGPNELVRYSQEGFLDLPGLFRPNILGRVSLWVLWALAQIYSVVGNWGLSIVVLTLVFRALIWPLITTQTKSMYGMQAIQPKIQALQKKHKDDREKLTQETMKIYKEAGVNPAGGCLPIIVQMPLFIILWRIFANFEFDAGFLWIPDLGQPDPFYILPILYVAVIFAQSYFMAQGNPQMLRQQLLMNVVFVFLFLNFPAGVILYYVVSMMVQVFQYWLIRREQPATPVKATKA